jgi:hypothetical protein
MLVFLDDYYSVPDSISRVYSPIAFFDETFDFDHAIAGTTQLLLEPSSSPIASSSASARATTTQHAAAASAAAAALLPHATTLNNNNNKKRQRPVAHHHPQSAAEIDLLQQKQQQHHHHKQQRDKDGTPIFWPLAPLTRPPQPPPPPLRHRHVRNPRTKAGPALLRPSPPRRRVPRNPRPLPKPSPPPILPQLRPAHVAPRRSTVACRNAARMVDGKPVFAFASWLCIWAVLLTKPMPLASTTMRRVSITAPGRWSTFSRRRTRVWGANQSFPRKTAGVRERAEERRKGEGRLITMRASRRRDDAQHAF